MNSWTAVPLGHVANLLSGGTPSKAQADYWNGTIPWLTPKDMRTEFVNKTEDSVTEAAIGNGTRLAPRDALFIAVRGMSLHNEIRIVRTDRAMAFNQDIKAIIPQGIDGRFLFLALSNLRAQFLASVESAGHGTGRLPTDRLESTLVPFPPPAEQRAIAEVLGAIDDKIELNRRMSETLEGIARAIFKSWFVDFDPVRAKMEGRNPGLPAQVADLLPASFEDSDLLGEIPEGWRVAPLPDLIEINPSRSLGRNEVAPYLDMANMPTRGHAPDEVIERPFGSGMRFINGDTLVARITPCLENGKTAFVDFLQDGQIGWGSTEYIVLRPKPPLPEEFAYFLARSGRFRDFAIQSMTGSSGRQRVPVESLAHFDLVAPPPEVAQAFGRYVTPLVARVSVAVRESRTLAALRDLLLPKLMSGDIRVKDAEKLIGEAGA